MPLDLVGLGEDGAERGWSISRVGDLWALMFYL